MADECCELSDEEVEANTGEEILDPWDDEDQADWPQAAPITGQEIND